MRPSTSTVASVGIGVPLATIIAWIAGLYGIEVPGTVEAAFGVVIGALVGYFFVGGKAVDTEDEDPNDQAGFARPLMLAVLLAISAPVVLLQGCASVNTQSATQKLVVQAATMKFIEASDDRAAKAKRIVDAADQAKIWLDMDGVSIADLQAAMSQRIAESDLEPSDKLLASALVEVIVADLDARIGAGVLSPESRATVNTVLGWVEQAAGFY